MNELMRYKQKFDNDTIKLLKISCDFLRIYFKHSEEDALKFMVGFLDMDSHPLNEDDFHHLGAYTMSAYVHYTQYMGGQLCNAWNWVVDNNHHQTPRSALMYFNENYFEDHR